MKFFRLIKSTNPLVTGDCYPQIQTYNHSDLQVDSNFRELISSSMLEKLDFTPIFPIFKLEYKAKFTDLLSNVRFDYTVSKKMLDIILSHNILNYEFHPIKVQKKAKILDYYCFYIYGRALEHIDLEKSIFYGDEDSHVSYSPRRYVKINQIDDIIYWTKNNPNFPDLNSEKIVYKNYIKNLDMFKDFYFNSGNYVSGCITNLHAFEKSV